MTTETPRAAHEIGFSLAALAAAAATPYLMAPLAKRILMQISDGEVALLPLAAVSILLAPLPALALGILPDVLRRFAIAGLAFVFVATLLTILTSTAPAWVHLAESLSLGALTSTFAVTTLLPRREDD